MKFSNTKTRHIDEFVPITSGVVRLYTCGPTVYNYLHVGNWVAYIRWDILVRTLEASGLSVTRVMNITDVGHLVSDGDDGEDKMEKGAKREGKTAWEVAQMYTDDFLDGMKKLNLIEPTFITKATENIPQQIALLQTLDDKGFSYVIDDGVYFDTSKFKQYADFAHLDLADQEAGARVKFNPQKHNSSDFALWKFSPKDQHRDMEWDSPWGKGFPGWHLECSAMALDKLGETIDIHTGGIDHIPVHHTNEIAQSEAATGKPFANYWIHNNFLMVDGTKISKSLGNTYTLQDLANKGFSPDDFRMFVLQSHYSIESNFTWDNLQGAKNRLRNVKAFTAIYWQASELPSLGDAFYAPDDVLSELQNNMNSGAAISSVQAKLELIFEKGLPLSDRDLYKAYVTKVEFMLGLQLLVADITEAQKNSITQRTLVRESMEWAKSDKLRDELKQQGIEVRDVSTGQIWSRM